MASYYWPSTSSGSGGGVTSLNTLTGDVILAAGTGITLTPSGNTITIASSGGGGAIVDTGSYGSPQTVAGSGSITVPGSQRGRIYIASTSGAVTGVTIGAGSGTEELYIVGTSSTNTVQMISSTNIQLSGTIVFNQGTLLSLQWVSGLSKWLEVCRNEIP